MTEDRGGDPVCWLDQVCPECGALPAPDEPADAGRCWRCGELLAAAADDPDRAALREPPPGGNPPAARTRPEV